MSTINFNLSKQGQAALATAKQLSHGKVLTTESLLDALARTRDTSAGRLMLSKHITRVQVSREIQAAHYVDRHPSDDEIAEQLSGFNQDKFTKEFCTKPVPLVHEHGRNEVHIQDRTYLVSDYVLQALRYGQTIVSQQETTSIETRGILLGMVDITDSNAYFILFKLLLKAGNTYFEPWKNEVYNAFSYLHYMDGDIAKDQAAKQRQDNFLHNKLACPDYSPLTDFGRDLTQMAKDHLLPPVVGRQAEIRRLALVLNRRAKSNALLVGPAGVGKTAIAEGLAERIVAGTLPALADKTIIEITTDQLAKLVYTDLAYEAFAALVDELARRQNVVLFIDEIQNLRLMGGSRLINMLKPALARGDIQLVGATTPMEADLFFDHDEALARRFENISVKPLDRQTADQVISQAITPYENYYQLNYSPAAQQTAVDLATAYLKTPLPDAAFTILDNAGAMVMTEGGHQAQAVKAYVAKRRRLLKKLTAAKQKSLNEGEVKQLTKQLADLTKVITKAKNSCTHHDYDQVIGVAEVVRATEIMTHRHITKEVLAKFKKQRAVANASLLDLADRMKEHLIGQDEAVNQLTQAMMVAKAGLRKANAPIGSFFFAGSTGVGKTEAAKQLAIEAFGSDNQLMRFNMAEYTGILGVDSFTHDLYRAVINHPRGVLLFDEFEKVNNPQIFNILLAIMDDGNFLPNTAVNLDFSQTLIIMTSNLGARQLASGEHIGFGGVTAGPSNKEVIKRAIHNYFAPEFINRLDGIVIFNPLNTAALEKITALLLKQKKALLSEKGINLSWTPQTIDLIIDRYADPQNGARPLQRGIERLVTNELAPLIIRGALHQGQTVTLTVTNDHLQTEVA